MWRITNDKGIRSFPCFSFLLSFFKEQAAAIVVCEVSATLPCCSSFGKASRPTPAQVSRWAGASSPAPRSTWSWRCCPGGGTDCLAILKTGGKKCWTSTLTWWNWEMSRQHSAGDSPLEPAMKPRMRAFSGLVTRFAVLNISCASAICSRCQSLKEIQRSIS